MQNPSATIDNLARVDTAMDSALHSTFTRGGIVAPMDCPKDGIELEAKEDDHLTLQTCGECFGVFLDVADLNRILLRHNLPGLEKLGGSANVEELVGHCPSCQVDLIAIEGGPHKSLRYDTCESCGGIWLEQGLEKVKPNGSIEDLSLGIVDFYKRFATTTQH